jgi:hypothetical protein
MLKVAEALDVSVEWLMSVRGDQYKRRTYL